MIPRPALSVMIHRSPDPIIRANCKMIHWLPDQIIHALPDRPIGWSREGFHGWSDPQITRPEECSTCPTSPRPTRPDKPGIGWSLLSGFWHWWSVKILDRKILYNFTCQSFGTDRVSRIWQPCCVKLVASGLCKVCANRCKVSLHLAFYLTTNF